MAHREAMKAVIAQEDLLQKTLAESTQTLFDQGLVMGRIDESELSRWLGGKSGISAKRLFALEVALLIEQPRAWRLYKSKVSAMHQDAVSQAAKLAISAEVFSCVEPIAPRQELRPQ